MQLVDVGRNEPCPCGSSRKYKKCCLLARESAVTGKPADLEVAALVDRAIADDDWAPVHEVFDPGFTLFEPAAPLEHVRFRTDLITSRTPEASQLSRLCSSGWQRRCEQEIAYVLDRYELAQRERDGLRMALHLLTRFGVRSPLVEQLVELQIAERGIRARKLGNAMSTLGLTSDDLGHGKNAELARWIHDERPTVLLFADWLALRTIPADGLEDLWTYSAAPRICDGALTRLEQPEAPATQHWVQLAATTLLGVAPELGLELAGVTAPRLASADEKLVYESIMTKQVVASLGGAVGRIAAATESRGDYAGAAMLRETMRRVQSKLR